MPELCTRVNPRCGSCESCLFAFRSVPVWYIPGFIAGASGIHRPILHRPASTPASPARLVCLFLCLSNLVYRLLSYGSFFDGSEAAPFHQGANPTYSSSDYPIQQKGRKAHTQLGVVPSQVLRAGGYHVYNKLTKSKQ